MQKKIIALVLAVMLVMSLMVPAYAAEKPVAETAADTITVYFTDNAGFGTPNVYYWDNGPEWPGTAMTFSETNDYGENVYKADVPANATGIIFNGNNKQTVDITTGIANNVQWYTANGQDEQGHYNVGSTTHQGGDTPVQPATQAQPPVSRTTFSGTPLTVRMSRATTMLVPPLIRVATILYSPLLLSPVPPVTTSSAP